MVLKISVHPNTNRLASALNRNPLKVAPGRVKVVSLQWIIASICLPDSRKYMMSEFYFTEKGIEKLKREIVALEKFIKRDIAKEIGTAREHGDLKENAEYAAAREKQANYMAKLGQLQTRFANARVVRKEDLAEDVITLGKRVRIKDVESGDEREYIILGEGETDIEKGIISYESPLAAALLSHKKGDVVVVKLPRGAKKFKVLEVEFFEG